VPFGINVNEMKAMFNDKFDQLIRKLDEILQELRKQNGSDATSQGPQAP
jgi:hypothetical protein